MENEKCIKTLCGSGWEIVAGSWEHGDEASGSINYREIS
jgi:hypothetical protein